MIPQKITTVKVTDIRVPLGRFDYIGPVYDAKRHDRFFTGKTESKQWRIVVDKRGHVYRLETTNKILKNRKGGGTWQKNYLSMT